jgi:hypothetical protein
MEDSSKIIMNRILVKGISLSNYPFLEVMGGIHVNICNESILKDILLDSGNGGAISGVLTSSGEFNLEKAFFENCNVSGNGGAISLDLTGCSSGSFIMNECSFKMCGGDNGGGALHIIFSNFNIFKFDVISIFINNNRYISAMPVRDDVFLQSTVPISTALCRSDITQKYSIINPNRWNIEDSKGIKKTLDNLLNSFCSDICYYQETISSCNSVIGLNGKSCIWWGDTCWTGACEKMESSDCDLNSHCQVVGNQCRENVCLNADFEDCSFPCVFDYSEQKCKADSCAKYLITSNSCPTNECVVDVEEEICRALKCSDLEVDGCSSLPFCTLLGGECNNNPCMLDNCPSEYCSFFNTTCTQLPCSIYSYAECANIDECVYESGKCVSGTCESLSLESCELNSPGCRVIYDGSYKCMENFCRRGGDYCFAPFCLTNSEPCVADSCHSLNLIDCGLDTACVYTPSSMCHAGVCGDVDNNECAEYNSGKCAIIGGQCEEDACAGLSGDNCGETVGCEWLESGKCSVDECMKYDLNGCVSADGDETGCIVKGGKCVKGECEELGWDECSITPRCKLITPSMLDVKECWTNICEGNQNCESVNCVIVDGECIFDACRMYDNDECNDHYECVYNSKSGCHKQTCSSIGSDINSCKLNGEKCVVVEGACSNGCGYPGGCDYYYCAEKENEDGCEYDSCAAYIGDECKELDGQCVYSGEHCQSGNYDNLVIMDECDANERCEIVFDSTSGDQKCKINACVGSDCQDDNCILVNNNCKFDKCSSYSNENCDTNRDCIISENNKCTYDMCRSYNNDVCNDHRECVFENIKGCYKEVCSNLHVTNCKLNGEKCVIVDGKCVNGCVYSEGCTYPYCNASNGCKYDVCAEHEAPECKTLSEMCVYSDNRCQTGNCEELSLDECSMNSRCKIIYDAAKGSKVCWTDSCIDCSSENCVMKSENNCEFDICRSYGTDECNGEK